MSTCVCGGETSYSVAEAVVCCSVKTMDRLVKTSAGVMWRLTEDGPAWFDGFRWHAVGEKVGLPARPDRITPARDGVKIGPLDRLSRPCVSESKSFYRIWIYNSFVICIVYCVLRKSVFGGTLRSTKDAVPT